MKIIPLSEGSFTVDKTKTFIPFEKEKDDLKLRATGSLLVEIQPFVIVTKKDIILLDTGLGFHLGSGRMQLQQNLLDNGIDPASVTKVLLSHLHKDHAGGIENKHNKDLPELSLPNATYYVNEKEFAFAQENKNSSYIPDDFSLLTRSPKRSLLDDRGTIDDYITYEISGGHCPFHTVFWIREEGETVFYGGDVAPQHQQMKNKFIAKYDFDGRKSMELRTNWWEQGKNEHWTFLFYHDIKSPTITL